MCRVMPFIFGLLLDAVLSDPGNVIPSKEEQANLLKNVEEVFNQVKVLVSDEGGATDSAVINDVQKMVDRALEHLSLIEESALIKISCSSSENSVNKEEAVQKIQKVIQEGEQELQGCIQEAAGNIYNNSHVVTTSTGVAMNQGQVLLDTLHQCSSKVGLNQISCYKKMHKNGHVQAISIRDKANVCVDNVLKTYQGSVGRVLSETVLV